MKLNSAQHARSAASRLDDVIDRSALEQAREGLGGRDIEEPLIGLEVQKSTLEWCETAVSPLRKKWTSLGLRDGKEPHTYTDR